MISVNVVSKVAGVGLQWSGTERVMVQFSPSGERTEPAMIHLAREEYQRFPPLVVRGSAFQAATASSVYQTVRLPR